MSEFMHPPQSPCDLFAPGSVSRLFWACFFPVSRSFKRNSLAKLLRDIGFRGKRSYESEAIRIIEGMARVIWFWRNRLITLSGCHHGVADDTTWQWSKRLSPLDRVRVGTFGDAVRQLKATLSASDEREE